MAHIFTATLQRTERFRQMAKAGNAEHQGVGIFVPFHVLSEEIEKRDFGDGQVRILEGLAEGLINRKEVIKRPPHRTIVWAKYGKGATVQDLIGLNTYNHVFDFNIQNHIPDAVLDGSRTNHLVIFAPTTKNAYDMYDKLTKEIVNISHLDFIIYTEIEREVVMQEMEAFRGRYRTRVIRFNHTLSPNKVLYRVAELVKKGKIFETKGLNTSPDSQITEDLDTSTISKRGYMDDQYVSSDDEDQAIRSSPNPGLTPGGSKSTQSRMQPGGNSPSQFGNKDDSENSNDPKKRRLNGEMESNEPRDVQAHKTQMMKLFNLATKDNKVISEMNEKNFADFLEFLDAAGGSVEEQHMNAIEPAVQLRKTQMGW